MNTNKSFHLRWNNHLSNLRTLLEFLYNEQSYVDVTLSCKDGLLRAHKLVLSACSPYFDTIFRENPCKHPTVILKGVSLREMQLIIEYMYIGSVDVPEEDLHSLLNTASELHVKGLVQSKTEPSENLAPQQNVLPEILDRKPFSSSVKVEIDEDMQSNYIDNNSTSNQVNGVRETAIANGQNMMYSESNGNENEMVGHIMDMAHIKMDECGNSTELAQRLSYNLTGHTLLPGEDKAEMLCKVCNRSFINKQNMKRHMQTHSGEKPHRCQLCNLSFLRLSHLQRHHRVHTGERPFACNQCDKQFSRSDKLKQHVAMHHSGFVPPVKQTKQRGRPRKMSGSEGSEFMLRAIEDIQTENIEYGDNTENTVPSFRSLQQVYNIPAPVNSVSVAQ